MVLNKCQTKRIRIFLADTELIITNEFLVMEARANLFSRYLNLANNAARDPVGLLRGQVIGGSG